MKNSTGSRQVFSPPKSVKLGSEFAKIIVRALRSLHSWRFNDDDWKQDFYSHPRDGWGMPSALDLAVIKQLSCSEVHYSITDCLATITEGTPAMAVCEWIQSSKQSSHESGRERREGDKRTGIHDLLMEKIPSDELAKLFTFAESILTVGRTETELRITLTGEFDSEVDTDEFEESDTKYPDETALEDHKADDKGDTEEVFTEATVIVSGWITNAKGNFEYGRFILLLQKPEEAWKIVKIREHARVQDSDSTGLSQFTAG